MCDTELGPYRIKSGTEIVKGFTSGTIMQNIKRNKRSTSQAEMQIRASSMGPCRLGLHPGCQSRNCIQVRSGRAIVNAFEAN